ncbi:MAG: cytochrome b [Hyphomicrobiales bacterium]|nr:cytochrome b [Hyphomicrobiales bacterium]
MSGGHSQYVPVNGFMKWMDDRLPLPRLVYDSFIAYPVPRNLNNWYTFGAILSIFMVLQIITGIVLAMHFVASTDIAFNSIESIMRDVNYGWLLRRLHANGGSFFFLAVYIHIFRGMYYGSYKAPREILWILGVFIFIIMMATAFMGYVLPWGQMSYWAATVITGLFSAIPIVGEPIQQLLLGGFAVGEPTLNRFFSLHYLLPFMLVGLVILHVWALHVVGQTNPTGVEVKDMKKETVPFTPYATMKDAFALSLFFVLFAYFVFYLPDYLGHPDNYIQADPLKTPAHIVPEWYFLPFYAILRAFDFNIGIPFTDIVLIDSKLAGVIAMFGSLIVLLFLPWLDFGKTRSGDYRPLFRQFFWIFVIVCIGLGYLGSRPAEGGYITAAQILTAAYFGHFLIILPWLSRFEKPKQVPPSIADAILAKNKAA